MAAEVTPMMAQWHACKAVAKDALLLFQMGEFYEAFYEDAEKLSTALDLTLTKRQETPMAGIPLHAAESYIDRLVEKGFRIAIADQTEDPKAVKGLVKREVVRIITPGTLTESTLLQEKCNNYIASVTQVGELFGLATIDLTTGEFFVSEIETLRALHNELFRLRPSELLLSLRFAERHPTLLQELNLSFPCLITKEEEWHFEHKLAYETLRSHFAVHSLDGFGLSGKVVAINAGGALLSYLRDTLLQNTKSICEITLSQPQTFLTIDATTRTNLELTHPLYGNNKESTLLHLLDRTATPMGGRMLRKMLEQPLLSLQQINERLDAVQELTQKEELTSLRPIRDLERLITRLGTKYATPRDVQALRISLEALPALKKQLEGFFASLLKSEIETLPDLTALIARALQDDLPLRIGESPVFREGYHNELDELRKISKDSQNWIACYQTHLREQTGIKTLKVGYNRAFGYYIEVSKGQVEKMPASFYRRQTLTNAERYVSADLKTYETKVLSAEERIAGIETELFQSLLRDIATFSKTILANARSIAAIDALHSLARVAKKNNFVRPTVTNGYELKISNGRHPVIESRITSTFTPNDTELDAEKNRLLLITGPNMAGKSTYIRQVALIVIMAQMGSFVPATRAEIGICDKVFSRIGASDDLTRGQSTFMVEMTETASILNNVTDRSLVILDEIGRGTSTYDGISIAYSVAEFLLTAPGKQAKTLFATHYFELTRLEEEVPGAANYTVSVQECGEQVLFLHKILRGSTDRSYGIHVARLAGMPSWVVERSKEILVHLEDNSSRKNAFQPTKARSAPKKSRVNDSQLFLF